MIRLVGAMTALALAAAAPAAAQPAPGSMAGKVAPFAAESVAGLPDFFLEPVASCFTAAAETLSPQNQELLLAQPDFIAGVNAVARADQTVAAALFPLLDDCGGIITAGERMWLHVLEARAAAPEADRLAFGACLLDAIVKLPLAAKNGISRYRFGNFADSIRSLLNERADLAGTIEADVTACGLVIPDSVPLPQPG